VVVYCCIYMISSVATGERYVAKLCRCPCPTRMYKQSKAMVEAHLLLRITLFSWWWFPCPCMCEQAYSMSSLQTKQCTDSSVSSSVFLSVILTLGASESGTTTFAIVLSSSATASSVLAMLFSLLIDLRLRFLPWDPTVITSWFLR